MKFRRSVYAVRGKTVTADRICENMALPTVLAVLTPTQYEAIATLAAFDNAAADAADHLGMKYHRFMWHVYRARESVRAVWFEDETPPQKKKVGETCRSGHSRDKYGRVRPANGMWECTLCIRNSSRRRNSRDRNLPLSVVASFQEGQPA